MKIPKRIVGFLKLNDSEVPFEYDKGSFELRLYHPSESDALEQIFDGLKYLASNPKEHKWVDTITLKGKTAEGSAVYFGTSDNPSSYNGYRTYYVNWYYITDDDLGLIDEIRFYGQDIDYFYSPVRAFQQTIQFNKEKYTGAESFSVETTKTEPMQCGCYMRGDNRVDISCDSYAIMHSLSSTPLDSNSFFKLSFSKKVGIEELVCIAREFKSFLVFVTYRLNVTFTEIATYLRVEDEKKRNCGQLVFNDKYVTEQNEKAKKRIVKAEYLNVHIAEIMEAISKYKMPYGHFCKSIEKMPHYPVSRIIMILAAFEREFKNIYGQDVKRSELYIDTKKEVVQMLIKYAESLSGKKKKYVSGFAKGIENHDSSYGDNFKYALEDCKKIMEPFIKRKFDGTYEEIIEDVSESINSLRNGVAHSRLDLELEAKHLTEIKIVEEMLYAIRLKKVGIDEAIIQKAINELFGENFAI